ncbi:menaquinone-specific isochorismate synthase [Arcanobacterium wilhelmae]|uniref:Menaquinone-specific isochorismate synthase n=1 Tax=Arcanobacterium wilhelmae TaxID=1803177 RepID=A0ABT9NA48_9ACTO|nr:chorismate-binding protein [Arcanobacterium wilhelmae]MDP9800561.1 menaquinone-specific isochorismate synthase [Arcanobacterium wilhelmae]WFN89975.1 chorismate-binding protein [Arcanobacterium wilhelmae]
MLTMPQLRAQTTRLPRTVDLEALIPDAGAHVWLRGEDGLVGAGVAARLDLEPRGGERPEDSRRFAEGAQWWQMLCEKAEIRDDVALPGTGLVSFGSFAFDAGSQAGSALLVPQVVVGKRGEDCWITLIGVVGVDVFDTLAGPAKALLDAALKGETTPVAPMPAVSVEDSTGAAFEANVSAALEQIRTGEAEKIVVARSVDVSSDTEIPERTLAARLHQAYPDCWIFDVDGLIGATPEMLAQSSPEGISVRVLAGTGAPDGHDLMTEKNLAEHALAAASAREALAALGEVKASEPFVLKLANVSHIATDLVATPSFDATPLQIAGALHPTAALGGTPRAAAMASIAALETTDRDRYGAPVGWMDAKGEGQWAVALRCLRMFTPSAARAWAGAGIVEGSDPATELAETRAKFAPIMEALGVTR